LSKFLIVDFRNKEIWDSLICKDADIYYKWQYVDAFKVIGDGQPFLAYYESGNSKLYNVFLKRDISNHKFFKTHINDSLYYDITTPYGYGGIVLNGEENIIKEYQLLFDEYCIKNNIICEFVRLNPLSDNFKYYLNTHYECRRLSNTVYIQLESETQIWNNFKSQCRNKIRKAQNNGIEIKSGFNNKFMDEFKNIYYHTMNRDNGTDYYFFDNSFFKSVVKKLNRNATIYTAYYNDKPISSILILFSGKNAHYHLGGSLYDYMKLGANNILIYSAACDLVKRGYSKLHLGGGYGGEDSTLLKYKQSFNPKGMLDFYICKRIYDKDVYNYLIDLRKSDENFDLNSFFFPLYRQ
jgi:hypothetical protein